MANDDSHPADGLAQAFQGLFNGNNIKQAFRDAWDRHFGPSEPAAPQESDTVKDMNKAAMDKTAQDVAQSYRDKASKDALTPVAAAKIRAKAAGK